jgi:hypothetical protein
MFYNIFISPHNGTEGIERAMAVVFEQLAIIRLSFAAEEAQQQQQQQLLTSDHGAGERRNQSSSEPSSQHQQLPYTLYYNTIGMDDVFGHTNSRSENATSTMSELMRNWCEGNIIPPETDVALEEPPPIACVHINHYETAFEEVTLQSLYDYCHVHPSHSVVYLHSKGSYQQHGTLNQAWRPHLTTAATHRDCIHPPVMHDQDGHATVECNVCGLQFYPLWAPVCFVVVFFP